MDAYPYLDFGKATRQRKRVHHLLREHGKIYYGICMSFYLWLADFGRFSLTTNRSMLL